MFSLFLISCGGGGSDSLPPVPTIIKDKIPPLIISTAPISEQAGVDPNNFIRATFSESIDSNVTTELVAIYLVDSITGTIKEPPIQLDATLFTFESKSKTNDTLVVPFINNNDLKPDSQYRVIIDNIKDLSGNAMKGNCQWDFTTRNNLGEIGKKITIGNRGVCGTTPVINPPDKPEQVQAFSVNETTILINWKAPLVGSTAEFYQIERSTDNQVSFKVLSQNIRTPSFIDTKTSIGVEHIYRVTAGNNASGFSFVFTLSNTVTPSVKVVTLLPKQVLSSSIPSGNNRFGSDFILSPDGTTLAVQVFKGSDSMKRKKTRP